MNFLWWWIDGLKLLLVSMKDLSIILNVCLKTLHTNSLDWIAFNFYELNCFLMVIIIRQTWPAAKWISTAYSYVWVCNDRTLSGSFQGMVKRYGFEKISWDLNQVLNQLLKSAKCVHHKVLKVVTSVLILWIEFQHSENVRHWMSWRLEYLLSSSLKVSNLVFSLKLHHFSYTYLPDNFSRRSRSSN